MAGTENQAQIGIIGGTGTYDPELLEDAKQVEVKVPGHFPVKVKPAGSGEETTVRLVRAREIRVRTLMPDGTPTMLAVLARVAGEEREYRPVRYDPKEKAVVLLVPRRAVTVLTDPRFPTLEGEAVVGPDVSEVVLKLRPK